MKGRENNGLYVGRKVRLYPWDALAAIGRDPVRIAHEIMRRDTINMHGPEHHFLDGAAFLAAYRNAGGEIDLDKALDELAKRTVKMPGAMCGQLPLCTLRSRLLQT